MEHRVGKRIPVRLAVTLAGRHCPELQGEILDLSARGAFIRLRGDYSGLRNIVRLRFPLRSAKPEEYCECWAMIVRDVAGGIGVMFDQLQEAAIEKLNAPGNTPRSKPSIARVETYKTRDRADQHESVTR
jgi:hypothetical protein